MDVEKTIEFILEQMANVAMIQAKREEIGDRTDRRLDRAIRLAVREARNERKRRQELDARLTASLAASQARVDEEFAKMEAAHRALEETMDRFIQSMIRGGNGSHGKGSE